MCRNPNGREGSRGGRPRGKERGPSGSSDSQQAAQAHAAQADAAQADAAHQAAATEMGRDVHAEEVHTEQMHFDRPPVEKMTVSQLKASLDDSMAAKEVLTEIKRLASRKRFYRRRAEDAGATGLLVAAHMSGGQVRASRSRQLLPAESVSATLAFSASAT